MNKDLIAAIDLGSNSFRLQVGRIRTTRSIHSTGWKESVRLAAGLSIDKYLDNAAQQRGVTALRRFNERLGGFAADSVRAVATNTLRVAKNSPEFLIRAETALGFPIEVIAGREEARLIYVGSHIRCPTPQTATRRGYRRRFDRVHHRQELEPLMLESLHMGCVGFSLRYFPNGTIDKRGLKGSGTGRARELQAIAPLSAGRLGEAVGSSGSAKALLEILEQNGLAEGAITLEGLERLRTILLKAGSLDRLQISGLKADRLPVLFGGFAIMSAIFREFGLERMVFSEGALRLRCSTTCSGDTIITIYATRP